MELKKKAPYSKAELDKALKAVEGKVKGVTFDVKDQGNKWSVTTISGGKKKRDGKIEVGAKKQDGKNINDERSEEKKKADKLAAIGESEKLLSEKDFKEEKVRDKLIPIKNRYKLLTLNLVIDSKKGSKETLHFTASASEEIKGETKEVEIEGLSAENIESEKPDYSAPDSKLGGVEMTAHFLTPKHLEGSRVTVKPPIMNEIQKKRDGTRLYVQGHLLNRLLGGPGNDIKNLTPLTYKANGDHERDAESEVKSLVHGNPKQAVFYQVKVIYPQKSDTNEPSPAEGRLATKLMVSWHTWKILSVNPLKKEKGTISKGPIPIYNVGGSSSWPHI